MSNKLTVYIGYDSSNYGQRLSYEVCERSIRNFNKSIKIVKLDRKKLIYDGLFYRDDNTGSTEFTYTRFLVPYLNYYDGWALFCDSDFLWDCDINDVFNKYCDNKYSVYCVKHNYSNCFSNIKMDGKKQEYYPRKNWSSLMLFNCSHNSTKNLNPSSVSNETPQWLHRMNWCNDDEIGEIDKSYNYLVGYYNDREKINAYHFTDGGPWFEQYQNIIYGDKWLKYINEEEYKNIKLEFQKDSKSNMSQL